MQRGQGAQAWQGLDRRMVRRGMIFFGFFIFMMVGSVVLQIDSMKRDLNVRRGGWHRSGGIARFAVY